MFVRSRDNIRGVQPLRIQKREQTQDELQQLLDSILNDNSLVIKGRVEDHFLLDRWSTGFTQGKYDPCLFKKKGFKLLLSTDDILSFKENTKIGNANYEMFKQGKKDRFEITEDDGTNYLGVLINKNEDSSISLSMSKKIEKLRELIFPNLSDDEIPKPTEHMWMDGIKKRLTKPQNMTHDYIWLEVAGVGQNMAGVGLLLFLTKGRFDCSTTISFLSTRSHCCSEMDLHPLMHTSAFIIFT